MNRAYKVIWSKARHCYVVVSELTKSQHKSSSKSELISTNVHREGNFGKAAIAAIVAGLLTFGGVAYSPVLAADNTTVKDLNGNEVTNTDKNITDIAASKTHFYSVKSTDSTAKNYNNDGATGINALAAGVGANAEADHSIAIGTGAWTNEGDGRVKGSGDIAIGHNATIHNYVNQSGSIALGQNALIENTFGSTEKNYAFNQTTFTPYGSGFLPADANKEATGIAIGRNSFARTGSLMVGTHMYKGAIADMNEVDGTNSDTLLNRDFNNVNMTTLGTNSFNTARSLL